MRDGADELELTDDDVQCLTTWTPDPQRAPRSVELSAFVAAASAQAIDRGEYLLVVGPNLGAQAAGRGLARFADLLGPDAFDVLQAAAERNRRDGVVDAELAYLPTRFRSANVTIRPSVHQFEIPVGVAPGVPADRVIPVHELAVFVADGRLRLWWTARQLEVSVWSGHMLNPNGAPPVCRFLHEIGQDGVTPLAPFDWGPAANLPVLPRVRVGRIVLRPGQWRRPRARLAAQLHAADAAEFPVELAQWRARWRVPRHVHLGVGDNRLLLDLESPQQTELLRAELCRERTADITVQEALPGPHDAWLPGPDGRYASEVVIPLVRAAGADRLPDPTVRRPEPVSRAVAAHERLRAPGTDWLYVALYRPRPGEDDYIAGPLREIADGLVAAGDADGWFYVRYSDPDRHLRLRLHGDPAVLRNSALPALMSRAAGEIASGGVSRVVLSGYEREIERYGGIVGMRLAESVFMVDSQTTAQLLGHLGAPDATLDPTELAVLSADRLLSGLGLDDATRHDLYRGAAPPPVESGAAYRQRSRRLREVLGNPRPAGVPDAVLDLLDRRDTALASIAAALRRSAADGELTAAPATIARSYLHMHCNRLGVDRRAERLVLGLLQRTRASLAIAPLDVRLGSRLIQAPRPVDCCSRSISSLACALVRSSFGSSPASRARVCR